MELKSLGKSSKDYIPAHSKKVKKFIETASRESLTAKESSRLGSAKSRDSNQSFKN